MNTVKSENKVFSLPLYKTLQKLIVDNTNIVSNMKREYKDFLGIDSNQSLLSCLKIFKNAFYEQDLNKRLTILSELKNKLLDYEIVLRLFNDCKLCSIKQQALLMETYANICLQLNGWIDKTSQKIK